MINSFPDFFRAHFIYCSIVRCASVLISVLALCLAPVQARDYRWNLSRRDDT